MKQAREVIPTARYKPDTEVFDPIAKPLVVGKAYYGDRSIEPSADRLGRHTNSKRGTFVVTNSLELVEDAHQIVS